MSDGEQIDGERLLASVPEEWRGPAMEVARRLGAAGHRAWIVGGCVRDLILGRPLKDLDIVSAALPDVVEELFEHTVAVGKSFGIVVVVLDGVEFEVATFRKERGYSDRRRPDEIEFSDSPEVDAGRRDFTCNALYLDPLDGTLHDPAGGLADLRAGILRAVGDPGGRFREDGLRILRLARFVSTLGLDPAPGVVEAARTESASLDGVSPERVLDELGKILRGPEPARAIELLVHGGHAARCMPGWDVDDVATRLRPRVLAELGDAPGLELGLATLFEPDPLAEASAAEHDRATRETIEALRGSRELRRDVARIAVLRAQISSRAFLPPPADAEERGQMVGLWRTEGREAAVRLAKAWARVSDRMELRARVGSFVELAESLDASAPREPLMVTAGDLMEVGVPRGPELGRALSRLTSAWLGGAFGDRAAALAWAERNLR